VGEDEVPVRLGRCVTEHLGGQGAERVDDCRVEVPAAAGKGHCRGGVDSLDAVEHLDGVGEVEQTHRERDGVATDIVGHTLAVPPREHLLQGDADVCTQAETLSHLRGGQAVRHQTPLNPSAPGDHKIGGESEPLDCRTARPHVAKHEPE
jgi:hypothetical protein